jgi:uncharacterized membrane protein YqgA involved in biofilm formation
MRTYFSFFWKSKLSQRQLDGFWTLILTVFFGVNFVFSAVGLYFVSTFTVISRPFALAFKTSPMMAGQRKEDVLP